MAHRGEKREFGDPLSPLESGTVVSVDPTANTVKVALDRRGIVKDARMVLPFVGALVGLRAHFWPSVNSRVWVLLTDSGQAFVLGGVVGDTPDPQSAGMRSTHPDSESVSKRVIYSGSKGGFSGIGEPPKDLLEGELELGDAMTGVIQLLIGMASLSAGDRARVEAHVTDELIRVVCNRYEHISAFGDLQVYDDGRLNVEFNGSSYRHEVDGQLKSSDPRFPVSSPGAIDFSKIDQVAEEGRWRMTLLLGHLGDFVRMLVTEPTKQLGRLAETALRAGKFQAHVGTSGSFLLQSTDEIAIEHVSKVLVPIRIKRWQDSTGVRAQDYADLDKKYLKQWKDATPESVSDRAYQIRLYARWFSEFASLARIHQMSAGERKDWKIPSETEQPLPDTTHQEADRSEDLVAYRRAYSCRRIFRNGAILDYTHHGHAIHMDERGIRMTSGASLWLEAAENIALVAGQNCVIRARRSIQMTADVGGIQMWARKWLRQFCKEGTLLLKSSGRRWKEGDDPNDDPEEDKKLDFPRRRLIRGRGIVIDSREAGIGVSANGQIHVITHGSSVGRRRDIVVSPATNLQIAADHVEIQARAVLIRVWQDLLVSAKAVLTQVIDMFDINKAVTFGPDGLNVKAANVGTLRTMSTIWSTRDRCHVWEPKPEDLKTFENIPLQDEVTSFTQYPQSTDESSIEEGDAGLNIKRDVAVSEFLAGVGVSWSSGLDGMWADVPFGAGDENAPVRSRTGAFLSRDVFLDSETYAPKTRSADSLVIDESLSHQRIRHDEPLTDPVEPEDPVPLYKEWAFRDLNAWPGEKSVFRLMPKVILTNVNLPPLESDSATHPKDYPNELVGSTSTTSKFYYRTYDAPAELPREGESEA